MNSSTGATASISRQPLIDNEILNVAVDENISTSTVIFDADATDGDGDDLTYSVSGANVDTNFCKVLPGLFRVN